MFFRSIIEKFCISSDLDRWSYKHKELYEVCDLAKYA